LVSGGDQVTFTVEHVFAESIVTVLDDTGRLEDVEWLLDEQGVFVRQWNEEYERYEVVEMTNKQLQEALTALGLPEGTYTAT
jgi:hypothetical protein